MTAVVEFLYGIGATIASISIFIVHSIESLLSLIVKLPTYISALTSAVAYLPNIYQATILATIAVSVMTFIIGRQKG